MSKQPGRSRSKLVRKRHSARHKFLDRAGKKGQPPASTEAQSARKAATVVNVIEATAWTHSANSNPLFGWTEYEKFIITDRDVSEKDIQERVVKLCWDAVDGTIDFLELDTIKRVAERKYRLEKTIDRTSLY